MALLHLFMCFCLYQAIPTSARQTHETVVMKIPSQQEKSSQNPYNSLFDLGVAAALPNLVDSDGIYNVPDIVEPFIVGGITGEFKTVHGTFKGLTSMKRTKDIVIVIDKKKYTMGTTVRLSDATVNIATYYARYGYVDVMGHVILNIKGISLTVKVSVDDNSNPCKIHLDEMSIHDVGDMDVDISGLGWPLNGILKPVIRGIIKTAVFEKAKERIAEEASQLSCEQATEIMASLVDSKTTA